ncbi:four helix bundle protein [Salinimicrobium xinjiangense]|uniref:four helix bundle protein n=1 Tax=Salinimicrobium xinjiangense TaxID=438596 RepID=UPI0003FA6673|nr:four helix bundle protein [Salinimicrobium xinjiangense]
MGTVKNFEDLEIWASARGICNDIFQIKQETELKSDFKLYNQLNGSSGSIMDNIAEGFERNGNREFIQFLAIAKASCGETRSQLYRALDRKYIKQDEFVILYDKLILLSKQISSFINYLQKSELKGIKFKA